MNRLFTTLLFIFLLVNPLVGFAANSQDSDVHHEYATVNTAPGASGYGTNVVSVKGKVYGQDIQKRVFFSVKAPAGTLGAMTITLQYKDRNDVSWNDYDTYTTYTRTVIEGGSMETLWQAIVKNGDYSSGTATFGFNW